MQNSGSTAELSTFNDGKHDIMLFIIMVTYKCHPHNEIDFSFQVDLKLVVAILFRLQVEKFFSTTGRDSALKCHRVNEIITRQFKSTEYEWSLYYLDFL